MGERKVPLGSGLIMIAWAFLFDLINAAVAAASFGLLDWIMDSIETIIFSIWLAHYGAGLWNKPGLTIATMVIDAVPFGDLTFPWTWRVAYSVFTERNELAEGSDAPANYDESSYGTDQDYGAIPANDNYPRYADEEEAA